MISKKEIMERICDIEENLYSIVCDLRKLEKKVAKLEPKKEKKTK